MRAWCFTLSSFLSVREVSVLEFGNGHGIPLVAANDYHNPRSPEMSESGAVPLSLT
jgi:hypothetical protein